MVRASSRIDSATSPRPRATTTPGVTRYRVLLAYARGEEAAERGEIARARDEWRRALTLDPSCTEAKSALARSRSHSLFGRLIGKLRGKA